MRGRLWSVAMVLGLAAGCGWLTGTGKPHYSEATEITPPWSEFALPVADATVTFSDAETLSVHHEDGDPASLGLAYGKALIDHGWTLDADTSAGDVINRTYVNNGDSLALSVSKTGRTYVVSLSILPF